MLSNTATPRYYGQFRQAVIQGSIPVPETISMEMRRIDNLIKNPGVFYDEEAVEHWIDFCENELVLTNGNKFKMLDSFKLWGEEVYGWYYFIDKSVYVPREGNHGGHYENKRIRKRLINTQYIIVGRGGAKTFYDTCHQAYFLVVDPNTTEQCATAPTMNQAEEVLMPFRTSIQRSEGPLFKFLTEGSIQNTTGNRANRPKLYSSKKGIEYHPTNSLLEVRPMRVDTLQGRHDKCATVDEWLSGDIREDPIDALSQGAAKNEDWLVVCTSSEGTVRNGIGDSIKLQLMDILKGKRQAVHTSIWWYRLDSIKEVNSPAMWVKANPNLGYTVSYETYQDEKEKAEAVPTTKNDFLAKRMGIPMEGFTLFFTYQETLLHRKKEYWGMACALGMDLSRGDDFCAFTFLFPLPDGRFGIKTKAYITERTMMNLQLAMRLEYEKFLKEGSLIVLNGVTLRMMDVYDDLDRHIMERQYDVRAVGYDPYNATEFIARWQQENGPFGVEKVIQGAKTESVPLGELKKLAEDRVLLFDEEIMKFAMGNCMVLEDTNGNRKLYKIRRDQKIDNVSAMMDAYIAYKINIENFD